MTESLTQLDNAITTEVNARQTGVGGLHLRVLNRPPLAFPTHQLLRNKKKKYVTQVQRIETVYRYCTYAYAIAIETVFNTTCMLGNNVSKLMHSRRRG